MGLPVAAQRLLLLAETGDTPDGQVRGLIGGWFADAGLTTSATAVQLLTVKERIYGFLLSYWRDTMSRVLDDAERATLKLRLDTLEAARGASVAERAVLLSQATASGVPVAGRLTTTAPWDAPAGWGPDPNAPRYGGDPAPHRRRA